MNKLSQEYFFNIDDGFQRFCDISLATLNKHAPCKLKHVRGNQMPFFDKELSKAIMTRTKLRKKSLQNESEGNRKLSAKQRNLCLSLLRKIDIKHFLKTVKPFLSDKIDVTRNSNNKPFLDNIKNSTIYKRF